MNNFDLKKYLSENKLTSNSKIIVEQDNMISPGDTVRYTNPVYHKEFQRDISFFTNTPKNDNIPFENYIKDQAIGKVLEVSNNNIALVQFEPQYFFKDSINPSIPYKISFKYLTKV
jgi:hypothetical protein